MTPAMVTHPKFLAASLSPAEEGVDCPLAGATVGMKESAIVSPNVGSMDAVGGGGIAVGFDEAVGKGVEVDGAIESVEDIVSAMVGAIEVDGGTELANVGKGEAVGKGETDGSNDPVPASEPTKVGNAEEDGANVGDSSLIIVCLPYGY
jgi:hypothetical protein